MVFKHEFVTMTCLCYLKVNADQFKLLCSKRGQILWSALMCQAFMICMLAIMLWAVMVNENDEYETH